MSDGGKRRSFDNFAQKRTRARIVRGGAENVASAGASDEQDRSLPIDHEGGESTFNEAQSDENAWRSQPGAPLQ